MTCRRLWFIWPAMLCLLLCPWHTQPAQGYITTPVPTLSYLIDWSTYITLVRIEKVSKDKGLVQYRKVCDIKGRYPKDSIGQVFTMTNIPPYTGTGGVPIQPVAEDWEYAMRWAQPGKLAVIFSLRYASYGDFSHTYIDGCWYAGMCPRQDWGVWYSIYSDPGLLSRWHCGTPAQLAAAVQTMLTGKEAVVAILAQGTRADLRAGRAKIQGMKVGLNIRDYDPKRDLAPWGKELRVIVGMRGFTHIAGLTRTDPQAGGIAPADFDGDGQTDVLLFGLGRVALLQNDGGLLNEFPLPLDGGARSAEWADCNGDGKPDLLLATPTGPKLLVNQKGAMYDASIAMPRQLYYNTRAAAWIDYDGDGKPDVLVADGFRGLRLYHNKGVDPAVVARLAAAPAAGAAAPVAPAPGASAAQSGNPVVSPLPSGTPVFEDVSDAMGLGEDGAGSGVRGDALLVADMNGDGRSDVLFCAAGGVVLMNTPRGFVRSSDSGINFAAGAVRPAFGDFDGDGKIDLFVPQAGTSKLYRNDGKGRFTDVTARAGDLAKPMGLPVCAAWVKASSEARPDLLVGCLKNINRWFRNNGDGTFTDISEQLGLHQRIFNSRGLCVVDVNKDGVGDLLLNNEGQESAVLLADSDFSGSIGKTGARPEE